MGYNDTIDYITIASTGNATDFGNLNTGTAWHHGCCDETRAVFMGGVVGGATNTINYLTIATTGNSSDFGNLITAKYAMGVLSGATRAVAGGADGGYEVIQYVTILTTGDAVDFGDLTTNIAASTGTAA